MALIVFNLTGAAVALAAGSPIRTIPASAAPPARSAGVDCTSELKGLSGANYLALEAQRVAGTLQFVWSDGVAQYATTGLTVAGPVVASSAVVAQTVVYLNPIAAELISIVADVAVANGPQIIAAQPDFPRKLQVRITDADSSISAGVVTIVGVGVNGQAVTEAVTLTGGTAPKVTTNAFATVTSATVSALAGAAAADHISLGVGAALAVPTCVGASAFSVYKEMVGAANETVGTVDATAFTIAPTTAADGTKTHRFFYKYTLALA